MSRSGKLEASSRRRRRPTALLNAKCLIAAAATAMPLALWPAAASALTPLELLGKQVFFDRNLSRPRGKQACASCHDAASGWVLPLAAVNRTTVVAPGAQPGAVGSLKTPPNAYSFLRPDFRFDNSVPFVAPFVGGNFWDGRAEGCFSGSPSCPVPQATGDVSAHIGLSDLPPSKQGAYAKFLGPTADQALNPFPNPVEQNIPVDDVCREVQFARYGVLYRLAFGERIDCGAIPVTPEADRPALTSFKRIAVAIAAWQASREVNSFSSKRDLALRVERDRQSPAPRLHRSGESRP